MYNNPLTVRKGITYEISDEGGHIQMRGAGLVCPLKPLINHVKG